MVNNYLKKIGLLFGVLLALNGMVWAGGSGTSNAEFLRIPAGAEPAAMGGGYSAIATDVNASFWNPAGLALIDHTELSFTHLSWFESLNYEYIAYAQSTSDCEGFGAHLIYFWVPDFNSTIDENGVIQDDYAGKMSSLAMAVSYGYNFGYLDIARGETAAGVTMKVLSNSLMDQNSTTFAIDAGLMTWSDMGYVLAVTLNNLGTAVGNDQSPTTLKIGVGYPVGFNKEYYDYRLALDIIRPIDFSNLYDNRVEVAGGLEYIILKKIALRLGYHYEESLSGITMGIGAEYREFTLDYAFAPYGELGYTHRFSLSYDFPLTIKKSSKESNYPSYRFKYDY